MTQTFGAELSTSNLEAGRHVTEVQETALVALGGLLTAKQFYPLYSKLLKLDTTSRLTPRERFMPPPQRGLGTVEGMRREMNERLSQLHEQACAKLDQFSQEFCACDALFDGCLFGWHYESF